MPLACLSRANIMQVPRTLKNAVRRLDVAARRLRHGRKIVALVRGLATELDGRMKEAGKLLRAK